MDVSVCGVIHADMLNGRELNLEFFFIHMSIGAWTKSPAYAMEVEGQPPG